MNYGLIGRNISYSFSESYFNQKFKELQLPNSYFTLDLATLDDLDKTLKINNIKGFNVTIPFKEEILKYLDELDPIAQQVGAVNCVKISEGKRMGYNTDVYGFEQSLKPLLTENTQQAMIFGNGGAAKAVKFVLDTLNIPFKTVGRSGNFTYNDLTEKDFKNSQLLINTTPVGTFPKVDEVLDLPMKYVNENHLVYDLIYNPEKTRLLQESEKKGARIKNGYEMLELQAERSYEIWNS